MGFRLYKSVKLGTGVRLNLSKTGVGISAWRARGTVLGALVRSNHPDSGRTEHRRLLPKGHVLKRWPFQRHSSRGAPVVAVPVYPKAGLLAPKAEKMFVQGVTAYMQGRYAEGLAAFQDVDARDQSGEHVGEEYFAGMCLVGLERVAEAISIPRDGSRI